MKKYLAAALAIAIPIGPASALDVGVGGKVGGIGVGAGLGAGSQGVSAGVGASADGVGGANVGASTGGGSLGVNAGGNLGSTSTGVSTSVGAAAAGDDPSAVSGSAASAQNPAAVPTAPALAKSATQTIVLPPVLRPSRSAGGDLRRVTKGYRIAPLSPPKAIPGTPAAVVRACRAAAAKPLGAVRVYTVSAGPLRQRRSGLNAPIEVRIDYDGRGGIEVRQAKVGCRLNAKGAVTAVI
ncbi:MAG: hypothetical protein EOQ34_13660 [Mesorhizobium sp.]|nr:hypothetical protein [Mesorhizobium sp.]RWF71944.1 MAG: hypothetical protein EOQ34_13660 [Mesorhizobium sp.]